VNLVLWFAILNQDLAFSDMLVPNQGRKLPLDSVRIGFQRLGIAFITNPDDEEDVNNQPVFDYLTEFKKSIKDFCSVLLKIKNENIRA